MNTKNIYWSFIFLTLLCLLFMFAEIINHRFWLSDFEVYYKAAQRILASKNLYRYEEDGHYVFKYSPTSALFFIPFTIFNFEIAKCIYWLFLTFLIGSGFYLSLKMLIPVSFQEHDKKTINKIVCGAIFILALHFLRELHLGQVNDLLLFVYIFAVYKLTSGKWLVFSIFLAISIFIKPFAFLFLPYLLVKKMYKELVTIFVMLLILAIVPLLFYGSVNMTLQQYQLWFRELAIELSHKQSLLADANHTIFSVFARYTPLGFLLTTPVMTKGYQLCMLTFIGIFVYCFIRLHTGKNQNQKNHFLFIDFSLLIALIPLLAFTSENAFIYTQPLVFVILYNFKKLKAYERMLAIVGFVFIGGNFAELIGKQLSQTVDNLSLVSIGTIFLICLLFVLRKKKLLDGKDINTTSDMETKGVIA